MIAANAPNAFERRLALEGVRRTEMQILRLCREEKERLERENRNMEEALALIRAREAAKSFLNPSGKPHGSQ